MSGLLAITLADNTYERAHQALMTAAAALSINREVIFFGAGRGVIALTQDWHDLQGSEADAGIRESGVAGFETLREVVVDMGGRLMACESGMRIAGISEADLWRSVTPAGLITFLEKAGNGPFMTF